MVPKVAGYTLLATAFFVFFVLSPGKHHGGARHLGLSRRLGKQIHKPTFDPLVSKIERLAEDRAVNNNNNNNNNIINNNNNNEKTTGHEYHHYHHHPTINDDVPATNNDFHQEHDHKEVEDEYEYFSEDGKLNITMRLKYLFPLVDVAPKDDLISHKELEDWNVDQAIDRLNYRTEKEFELRDDNGDGSISFDEYFPQFSQHDLDNNKMEHGEAGWWREQFVNADFDKNGSLSFDEFNSFLHPEDSNNDEIQKWLLREKIKRMDYTGDGKLNFEEFLYQVYDTYRTYAEFETDPSHIPAPNQKFFELDLNKNNLLEVEELKPIFNYLHPGEVSHAKYYTSYLIQEADDNKDGYLSLDEMLNHEFIFYSTVYDDEEEDDEDIFHDEL